MVNVVRGQVVSGYGEGRKIGFPTANLQLGTDSFRPPKGVYAVWVSGVDDQKKSGILVSGVHWESLQRPRVEVYVLDFVGDLYGKFLSVEIVQKIREVVDLPKIEELVDIIKNDITLAKTILK